VHILELLFILLILYAISLAKSFNIVTLLELVLECSCAYLIKTKQTLDKDFRNI